VSARNSARLICGIIASSLVAHATAPAASAESAQARAGAVNYRQYCQPCHGADLTGYAADNAPSLVSPTFRETAGDAFLRSAIERGRAGTAMAGYGRQFGGPLAPFEIDELIAFLRADTKPQRLAPKPSTGSPANGEQVYQANCQTCHGTLEQRATAVHLANPMFLETASDAFLRAAIVQGRPGTPMEAWGEKLSAQDIEDVLAYIRTLARPVPLPPPVVVRTMGSSTIGDTPIVINPEGEAPIFNLRDGDYVSVSELARAFQEKRRLVIVDARPVSDYLRMHIEGAISIPHFQMHDIDRVPNDGTWVITYCACPHHVSGIVMEEFRRRGFANTAVLDEGVFAWQTQGHPVVAAPGQGPVAAPPPPPREAPPREF
jgi:cytochrome c oxidase cbb3-type subunit III